MAIRGYYGPPIGPISAPYVEAEVWLHRLNISGRVEFLVDTGADSTSLHLPDARRLGIAHFHLDPNSGLELAGVGGALEYYSELATLTFHDEDGQELLFACEVSISLDPVVEGLPSLLGRDFLNRCSLLADSPENQVLITPANVIGSIVAPVW